MRALDNSILTYASFIILPLFAVATSFLLLLIIIMKKREYLNGFANTPCRGVFNKRLIPYLIIGGIFAAFCIYLMTGRSVTYYAMMSNNKNRLALLERGKIIEANVINAYYEHGAPAGWKVEYNFILNNFSNGEEKNYFGWSQGPEKYYINLSKGDKVNIIYDPCDPKKNCEIRCFLNHPSFRKTFRKAEKLNLLDRFRDKFELENYTFKDWYDQQQTKEVR